MVLIDLKNDFGEIKVTIEYIRCWQRAVIAEFYDGTNWKKNRIELHLQCARIVPTTKKWAQEMKYAPHKSRPGSFCWCRVFMWLNRIRMFCGPFLRGPHRFGRRCPQSVDSKRLNWSHSHTHIDVINRITTLFNAFLPVVFRSLSLVRSRIFEPINLCSTARMAKPCIFYSIECKQQAVQFGSAFFVRVLARASILSRSRMHICLVIESTHTNYEMRYIPEYKW